MSWSPLERDLQKLAESAPRAIDLTADSDNLIRATGKPGGRERIVALRETVLAVLEDRQTLEYLAEEAAALYHEQRAAAEQLEKHPELGPVVEAFTALADELAIMLDLADSGQTGLLLGSLANLEGRVEELDCRLDDLPPAQG